MTTEFSKLRQEAGLSITDATTVLRRCERTIYRWEKGEAIPREEIIKKLRSVVPDKTSSIGYDFTFIDLFAGIGGFRKGFESVNGRCVFTSEWDKYSLQTYLANHDCDHEVVGDITKVEATEVPRHDVLLAGFPCQPFSIAGVSKKNALGRKHGFRCDAQGTLFFDIARIIEHHRPKAFLLENVKNLASHDRGKTFEIIRRTLTDELGYNIHFRIIDAKGFVPQHRERIFIVGFRDDTDFNFDSLEIPDASKGPKLKSILHAEDGSEKADGRFLIGPKGRVIEKYTLSDHLWGYLQDYAAKHRAKGNGFGFGLVGPNDTARTLSARYFKDGSEILVKQKRGKNPRRLTPRECARLMGFESKDSDPFEIPVSDTQAYKQFGNAVVVPVVKSIALHMAPYLYEDKRFKIESGDERAVA